MSETSRLHIKQRAIVTNEDGVWKGRYTGEDWSVAAESIEAVMALLTAKHAEMHRDPEVQARLVGLAERAIAGEHIEDGFEAEYLNERSYDDMIIERMEKQFADVE
ncbi:hypothetical protein [Aldersonia kunmingensis]|uniref:hypothetical protein n=1 Tax=Aldersonia kunmingensis TaxID=408066 RepID=UPI000836F901|nr:hypothetical protein [Aldersonia kunmingensis]